MKSTRYGVDKEYCRRNGCRIFFGVDWLDDARYASFQTLLGSRQLSVSSADKSPGDLSASFSRAVKLESEFVDTDKYIVSPDDVLIVGFRAELSRLGCYFRPEVWSRGYASKLVRAALVISDHQLKLPSGLPGSCRTGSSDRRPLAAV